MNARIPKVASIETAVHIYWDNMELGNAEIKELFGSIGSELCGRLKRLARVKMAEHGWEAFGAYSVNTKAAYEAWGLDIADLETRLKKLRKLRKEGYQ